MSRHVDAVFFIAVLGTPPAWAQQEQDAGKPPDVIVVPVEEGEDPREQLPAPGDAILLDAVSNEDAPWLQLHAGGSVYDTSRNVVVGRWSPGLLGGYRFSRLGYFAMVELDQVFDFTEDTQRLDMLNVGAGVELLNFLGHVRTSIAVGASILLSDTAIDEAGEVGWFVDVRPAALRWALSDRFALEFTPLTLDVAVPVIEGIPLTVFTYQTLVGVEWSLR
jgi:hypothetical protein